MASEVDGVDAKKRGRVSVGPRFACRGIPQQLTQEEGKRRHEGSPHNGPSLECLCLRTTAGTGTSRTDSSGLGGGFG